MLQVGRDGVMKDTKPNYEHDCNNCVYLGDVFDSEIRKTVDLYFCASTPTVIARYSSDGPEYISGIAFVGSSVPLAVAFELAYRRGLLKVTANRFTL